MFCWMWSIFWFIRLSIILSGHKEKSPNPLGFGAFPLVREAGSLVLPRRFRQKLLNRTLLVALSTPDKLADLQREAENYGRNGDFYRRAQYAADLITGVEPR